MVKIWKISPGYNAELWDAFRRDECVAVGNWDVAGLGDLSQYSSEEALKRAGVSGSGAKQLMSFYRDINLNDVIIAYSEKRIWGFGKIASDYFFTNDSRYWDGENYIRKVEWMEMCPPIDISSDERLFGNPPANYGILDKQLTIIEIDPEDWQYILEKYSITV